MERMTFLNGDDAWCVDNENCFEEQSERYCGPAIDRLAYYEDMEEQGRLVVLEKKEHQADVLQYYKNYRDRLERYEQALKGGADNGDRSN